MTDHEKNTPQFVEGRSGTRRYSYEGLVERITDAFIEENGRNPDLFRLSEGQRFALIRETMHYLLNVESIRLDLEAQVHLVERAYSDLFGFSVLDPYLNDETITTISIKGVEQTAIRRGHGELVNLGQIFADQEHLATVIQRMLWHGNIPRENIPEMIEMGFKVKGRPLCLSLLAPPITYDYVADLRLHPASTVSLNQLADRGFCTQDAVGLLQKIAHSQYGFVIVGEVESGKTTLLSALLEEIDPSQNIMVIDRAGEVNLPNGVTHLAPSWGTQEEEDISFSECILRGVSQSPHILVLDEVRTDDPSMIAPLLDSETKIRQLWAVRGAPDAKRLQNGLGMLVRRAKAGVGEQLIHAFYERLPFVITVANIQGQLKLFSIAEWQSRVDSDYPDYVMLMRYQDGASQPTGLTSARWIT